LVQAFPKKWWVESDFTAPNLSLPLRLKGSGCHYNIIFNNWDNIGIIVINGRNSANLGLLIDKTSSIYLYVKLKALAS
jgi:hypothetical protein